MLRPTKPVIAKAQTEVKLVPITRMYILTDNGRIGFCTRSPQGELSHYELKAPDYAIKPTPKHEIYNIAAIINDTCNDLTDPQYANIRIAFALPHHIFETLTDLSMITKMFAFDVSCKDMRASQNATHPEIAEIKNWETYKFTEKEHTIMYEFLTNVITYAGRITFEDEQYIGPKNPHWEGTHAVAKKYLKETSEE